MDISKVYCVINGPHVDKISNNLEDRFSWMPTSLPYFKLIIQNIVCTDLHTYNENWPYLWDKVCVTFP
jgi:hypothetical protein